MRASVLPLLAIFVLQASFAAAAPDPADKCVAAKIDASGKHFAATFKCRAKAALAGTAVDPACLQKAHDKLGAAFTKAEAKGACTVTGDAPSTDAAIDTCADTVVGDVARVCGDGVISPSEACDDGNATSGDGCSAACDLEGGWNCGGEPTVCACAVVASFLPTNRGQYVGEVTLDASASYSGCGQPLQYFWNCYAYPGSCGAFDAISHANDFTNATPALYIQVEQRFRIQLTVCIAGVPQCAPMIEREYQGVPLP